MTLLYQDTDGGVVSLDGCASLENFTKLVGDIVDLSGLDKSNKFYSEKLKGKLGIFKLQNANDVVKYYI